MYGIVNLSEFKKSCLKSRSRFHFIDKIAETMKDLVYEECLFSDNVSASFDCNAGNIEVRMKNDGTCEVSVLHYDNERYSTMIESAISCSMPDWHSIQSDAEQKDREEREFQDYLWRNSRYW